MRATLHAQLAAARRRIRWAWIAATAGLVVPSVAAALMIVGGVAWLVGHPLAWWWFVIAPVALLVGLAVAAYRERFTEPEVARAVERRTGNDGVLISALEFVDPDDDWHADVQRRAAAVTSSSSLASAIPVRIDTKRVGTIVLAVAFGVALSVVPPFVGRDTVSAADRAVLDGEAERLEEVAELLDEAAESVDPRDESLDEIANELLQLAEEIRSAETPLDAAERLEEAADELRQRVGDDFLQRKAAVQGLEQQLTQAPLTPTGGDAAAQLDALAEAAGELDADEADELADRLDALADSQAAGNPAVADALRDAADRLRSGDAAGASSSLSGAAAAQRSASSSVADGTAASAAAAAADASAGRLRDPSSQQGQGDGQGQGQGDGQGQGQGEGQGQGQGDGQGQGQGPGQGQGQGQGQGGAPSGQTGGMSPTGGQSSGQGGVGTPGMNDNPDDTRPVDRATVFDPAPDGGPSDEVQVGIDGGQGDGDVIGRDDGQTTAGSSFVPYRDVLPQYLADAAAALDELQLPAELRTTVRNYFDGLAEGG